MNEVAKRVAKIRAYAEPGAAQKSGTYADMVWLCDELTKATDEVERLRRETVQANALRRIREAVNKTDETHETRIEFIRGIVLGVHAAAGECPCAVPGPHNGPRCRAKTYGLYETADDWCNCRCHNP